MAEQQTEPATPRKRRRARAAGQVAQSQDLTRAAIWCVGLLALGALGGLLVERLLACMRLALAAIAEPVPVTVVLEECLGLVALPLLGWLACVWFAAAVTALVQVGPLWTLAPMAGKRGARVGWGAQFGWVLVRVASVSLLTGVVVYGMRGLIVGEIAMVMRREPTQIASASGALVWWLGLALGAVALLWGGLDWVRERNRHAAALRMSRRELRQEQRETEADPRQRQQRARLHRELMQRSSGMSRARGR